MEYSGIIEEKEVINWLNTIRENGKLVSKFVNEANPNEVVLIYNYKEPSLKNVGQFLNLEVFIVMNKNNYVTYSYNEKEEK